MAKETIQLGIEATDDASKVLEEVAKKAKKIEDLKAIKMEIEAEIGKAESELEEVEDKAKDLEKLDPEVKVEADAGKAEGDLEEIESKAKDIDGKKVEIDVKADTTRASDGLTRVGDTADTAETRFTGLASGIDGVTSILDDPTPQEFAQGLADMGDSMANTVVPWMSKLGPAALIAGGGIAAAAAATFVLNDAIHDNNIEDLADDFLKTGHTGEELDKALAGQNAGNYTSDLSNLNRVVETGEHDLSAMEDVVKRLAKESGPDAAEAYINQAEAAGLSAENTRALRDVLDETNDELQVTTEQADATSASFDRLKGAADMKDTFLGVIGEADTLAGSLADLKEIQESGTATAEEHSDAERKVAEDANRLQGTIVGLVEEYGRIPEETRTQILAELPADQQAEFATWIDTVESDHVAAITAALPEEQQGQFTAFLAQVDAGAGAEILAHLPREDQLDFLGFLSEVDAGALAPILAELPASTQAQFDQWLANKEEGIDVPVTAIPETGRANSALDHTAQDRTAMMNARPNTRGANRELNNTARPRTQPTTARASTGGAESALNTAARPRTANITARITPSMVGWSAAQLAAFNAGRESGGHVNAGQDYIVGERRAEIFRPSVSGQIIPHPEGFGGGGVGGGGQTFNYNINLPKGTRGDDLLRTMRNHARRNGAKVGF